MICPKNVAHQNINVGQAEIFTDAPRQIQTAEVAAELVVGNDKPRRTFLKTVPKLLRIFESGNIRAVRNQMILNLRPFVLVPNRNVNSDR
ncbi:MAG: hypothetical protein ACREC8_08385 [Limisphaerales bacterium]